MEELKIIYENHKSGKINLEKFESAADITRACKENKPFILESCLRTGEYLYIAGTWTFGVFLLILGFVMSMFIYVGIVFGILFLGLGCLMFTKLGKYMIINRKGMYFKKRGEPKFIPWNAITDIKEKEKMIKGITVMFLTLYLTNGKKLKFSSKILRTDAFPRKIYNRMFHALFLIYWNAERGAQS